VNTKLFKYPEYANGFAPAFHPERLRQNLGNHHTYFIADMGDMWGSWVPEDWILKVMDKCNTADSTNEFWFLTKNPARYVEFLTEYQHLVKPNFVFGATIEGNDMSRFTPMMELRQNFQGIRTFLSVEPVLKFDPENFFQHLLALYPEFIYIGYDSGGNKLDEPELSDVIVLIDRLKKEGMDVREKLMREAWR
jgi:hypothetical protein